MKSYRDPQALHRERLEMMLRTAKTKADMVELVRMLDARNVVLQRVRDGLAAQLARAHHRQ